MATSLTDLNTETLQGICQYLGEEDAVAVSQTSSSLWWKMDENCIWNPYITEELRCFRDLKQQVPPELSTDGYCTNRRLLLQKNRVIENFKRQSFVVEQCPMPQPVLQGEQIANIFLTIHPSMLLVVWDCTVQLWNVGEVPVLKQSVSLATPLAISRAFLFQDDTLVLAWQQTLQVYRVDVLHCRISFLHSISIMGESTVDARITEEEDILLQETFQCYKAGRYLVCVQAQCYPDGRRRECPAVYHVWDMKDARKVGVLEAPFMSCLSKVVHLYQDQLVLWSVSEVSGVGSGTYHLCHLKKQDFSEYGLTPMDEVKKGFFFKHFLVAFSQDPIKGKNLLCQIYDLVKNDSVIKKTFEDAEWNQQYIPAADCDKMVIVSACAFHLVDTCSLDTLAVVAHRSDISRVLLQPTVSKCMCVVVLESTGKITLWNLDRELSSQLTTTRFNDVRMSTRDLPVNIVAVDSENVCVVHFW